jgi:hypothetical protein
MGFLKRAKDLKPDRSMTFLLHNFLGGMDKSRSLSIIHASDVTKPEGFCPRYFALHDVTKTKPKDNYLSTSENVTYQMGRDLQDNVVHWFADMGKAIGHWKCVNCNQLHEFCKRPFKCKHCGCHVFKPEEVRFKSEISGTSCGVDMLITLGGPKLIPVELKTMDKDLFKELKAPLAEHRLRTNLYLRLIEESKHPFAKMIDTKTAQILYVSKGGYGCASPQLKGWGVTEAFSPFKDYEIKRDDSATTPLVKRAKVVKDFRDGLVGMPCGICSTALVKRALSCSKKTACFSGDYPAQFDWSSDE